MKRSRDPRDYQIVVLAGLVTYGVSGLDFQIRPMIALALLGGALAAQAAWTRWVGLPRFDPKSAVISALSLCLLLRTNAVSVAALAALLAVSSKFVLRVEGRHVFNPANVALVVLLAVSPSVWVSPGQWGTGTFFAFLLAGLGGLVTHRASRSDVTYAFLASYAGLVFARALWLGDPMTIPLHQLQNGALLLFAFFMISDPKTTPDSRPGRIAYALLVAAGAALVQFVLFQPNGLLWSLVALAPTTPLINRLLPGSRYQWTRPPLTSPRRLSERSYA